MLGLLLFFTLPDQMAYIFLHTLHLGRGALGLLINRDLPKSHDLLREISKSLDSGTDAEDPLSFEGFRTRATQ